MDLNENDEFEKILQQLALNRQQIDQMSAQSSNKIKSVSLEVQQAVKSEESAEESKSDKNLADNDSNNNQSKSQQAAQAPQKISKKKILNKNSREYGTSRKENYSGKEGPIRPSDANLFKKQDLLERAPEPSIIREAEKDEEQLAEAPGAYASDYADEMQQRIYLKNWMVKLKTFPLLEDLFTEFKDFTNWDQSKKSIIENKVCGMLNRRGGSLFIGITDKRQVKGILLLPSERDTLSSDIITHFRKCNPPIDYPVLELLFYNVLDDYGSEIDNLYIIQLRLRPPRDRRHLYFTQLNMLFVRNDASNWEYKGERMVDYIQHMAKIWASRSTATALQSANNQNTAIKLLKYLEQTDPQDIQRLELAEQKQLFKLLQTVLKNTEKILQSH